MSKYYVTCGGTQWIVQAESARQAAMRLLDELLAEHIWIYDDADLSEQDRRDHLVIESLLHLATEIHVSERGTGRCDAGTFGVPELLDDWDRLMTAVSRLFVAAGLAPRRVLPQAAAAEPASGERGRLPS
jgi:hypothetical protein